jgi:hypothetical protein
MTAKRPAIKRIKIFIYDEITCMCYGEATKEQVKAIKASERGVIMIDTRNYKVISQEEWQNMETLLNMYRTDKGEIMVGPMTSPRIDSALWHSLLETACMARAVYTF